MRLQEKIDKSKKDKRIELIFSLSFCLIIFLGVGFHEMWRDELQAWLIARDSNSLYGLFKNLRLEGHPSLWHLKLFLISRVFKNPISMQYLNALISSISIFIIFSFSPFKLWEKILIASNYYIFYEYALIARNYSVGVLLILISCCLFRYRDKYPVQLSLTLVLLSNSNVLGFIFSSCIFSTIIFEELIFTKTSNLFPDISKKIKSFCLIFITSGYFISLIQMIPSRESSFNGVNFGFNSQKIYMMIGQISQGYFSPFIRNFYNNDFFKYSSIILLFSFICILITFLYSKPTSLFNYISTTFGLLMFFNGVYPGSARHHGYLFIALISSIWIFRDGNLQKINTFEKKCFSKRFLLNILLGIILIFQSIEGINAFYKDIKMPFSSAKRTAEFIKKEGYSSSFIIGYGAAKTSAVLGYLPSKKFFYYPETDRMGSFIKWDKKMSMPKKNIEQLIIENSKKYSSTNEEVLLILDKSEYDRFRQSKFLKNYDVLFQSLKSLRGEEGFYILKFNK